MHCLVHMPHPLVTAQSAAASAVAEAGIQKHATAMSTFGDFAIDPSANSISSCCVGDCSGHVYMAGDVYTGACFNKRPRTKDTV
jgi:hypothetical protein